MRISFFCYIEKEKEMKSGIRMLFFYSTLPPACSCIDIASLNVLRLTKQKNIFFQAWDAFN